MPLLTRVPVGITLLDAVVLRCRVLLNSTYLELMIDDYGEIKNKNKEWGKLLYGCSTRYLRYLLSTRERVWWRVEMGVEWLRWGWG